VGGRATFGTLSIATPGSGYTLTAASSGLSGATSVAFTITAAQTTTTLVAVPTVTTGGSLVTFTATVTSNGDRVGAGTVTFALSTCTSPIPGGSNIALVGGAAVFMTTTLAVGTHDIVGCYSGGTDGTTTFAGSQSSAVTVVIMSGSG
jgi:hypothetical protein